MKLEEMFDTMKPEEIFGEMTDSQRRDLVNTMEEAILPSLSFKEAQAILDNKGPFIDEIRRMFVKRWQNRRIFIPSEDDKWFDLEVDDDIDPRDVEPSRVYFKGWEYFDPAVTGRKWVRAKLIRLQVRKPNQAQKTADTMGYRLVEGRVRGEVSNVRFPKSGGRGPIICGNIGTAVVMEEGDSVYAWHSKNLNSIATFCDDCWRWLVVAK